MKFVVNNEELSFKIGNWEVVFSPYVPWVVQNYKRGRGWGFHLFILWPKYWIWRPRKDRRRLQGSYDFGPLGSFFWDYGISRGRM